jgi:hypothetical protein
VREGFGAALRVAGPPSFYPEQALTESGYFRNGHPGRILLRFSNIPQGVDLELPRIVETGSPSVSGDGLRAQWVQGAGPDGAGGAVSSEGGTVLISSPPGGEAFVVYQVMDANPSVLESLPLTTTASWTTGADLDTIQMSVYPAPLSTVTAASSAAPEPRFLDAASPRPFFRLAPCRSSLLFPYASAAGGENTRLVLDNLTSDTPGTTPQAAPCRLRFRGPGAPSEHTTPPVPPGGQVEVSLASVAPGFSGHVVAECDFEAAAGKAIASGGGATYESDAEPLAAYDEGVPIEWRPLLIPYAVSADGFDTRIAIANPTLDIPGLPAQAGACRIDYFGQNAPPSQQSMPIGPGSELVFSLSAGAPAMGIAAAPNFSGYVTAICEFAYARGLAAITDPAGPAGFTIPAEPFDVPFVIDPNQPNPAPPEPGTHLLIPYASSRAGDETLLAISNASQDFLGTIPQAGACTLAYHGDGAAGEPGPRTFALSAGEQATFRLSEGDPARAIAPAPDFRGYLTLECDFPRARAAALVTSPTGEGSLAISAEPFTLPRDTTPAPLVQPYLSNQGGEDRVVVLASTSVDPFGTTPVNTSCSLLFRGENAPPPSGIPLAAGDVRAFVLSRGLPALGIPPAPGFKGFLWTSCAAGLVRAEDYRISPTGFSPFCEIDATPGVQSSDVVALTAMLGERVAIGHPGDPDGDGRVTAFDIQHCNDLGFAFQPAPSDEPDPVAQPDPAEESDSVEPVSSPEHEPIVEPDPSNAASPPAAPTPAPAVPQADLRLTWQASPQTARPQRPLTLTATVANAGSAAASNAVVTLYPPYALVLSGGPAGCTSAGNTWTCDLGTLAAGQSVMLRLSGTVASSASAELITFGEASSSAPDRDSANDTARLVTPLESQVNLSASAYLLPRLPAPGETATLTVSVTNRGPALAERTRLAAELGPRVQLQQTPVGCTLSGRMLDCLLGDLHAGRTKAFLLQVQIAAGSGLQGPESSPYLAVVSGSSSTDEYEPENNTFSLPAAP